MRLGGVALQHFLGYHRLLVYIMHIRQMAAEGAGLQCLPALDTLDIPCIPLGGGDTAPVSDAGTTQWGAESTP